VRNIDALLAGAILLVLAPAPFLSGQSSFERGEEALMRNNPEAALPALEEALAEDPANIKTYQYLGIVYLQLERPEDAIAVYLKALPRAGDETYRLAFNLGNAYFGTGNYVQAIRYYGESVTANPSFASAWLNRANARLRSGALREALEDYRYYLTLEPRSAKRPRIEELIAFVEAGFAEEERQRIAREEQARAEEEQKRRLMEEVSASLQADAGETQGLSAGSEGLLDYEGEFELE
jgi:tetratricopeptide (TPR) repeat protein